VRIVGGKRGTMKDDQPTVDVTIKAIIILVLVVTGVTALGLYKYHKDHMTFTATGSSNGGSGTNSPITVSNPAPSSPATSTPIQPPATPSESVTIKSVTSPASPGTDATLMAQTSPSSDCTIVVEYKSGPSHAQGLYEHNADASGSIGWTWFVGTNTTSGTWPINVSCSLNGQSASRSTSFAVN
jgi:micrococcal nuclease